MNNAFKPADILIPSGIDMEKWAVIACDQYTSQPEYWKEAEKIVGDSPSALNLILPEIYLEDKDVSERIERIHAVMNEYVKNGCFEELKNSFVYVERVQSNGVLRQGIVGMIDLEEYDFSKGSTSQVRATEATVVERIPPRIKVRQGAALELPHIMILIDDENGSVIEPLSDKKSEMRKLYDFELMQGGGSISGYLLDGKSAETVSAALDKLGNSEEFLKKYGTENVLLYAMGDGNHSLATAKQYYENLKKENPEKDLSSHPARYALAEIVNLHSKALKFEAIHRIVTEIDTEKFKKCLSKSLGLSKEPSDQSIVCLCAGEEETYFIHKKTSYLSVGSLQNFIDGYLAENGGKVDYIHGEETVRKLAASENSFGFILDDMDKSELFPTVIKDGSLPRKTFSMGHAEDKRYYIECRAIGL